MNKKTSIKNNSRFLKLGDVEDYTVYQGKSGMNKFAFVLETNQSTNYDSISSTKAVFGPELINELRKLIVLVNNPKQTSTGYKDPIEHKIRIIQMFSDNQIDHFKIEYTKGFYEEK